MSGIADFAYAQSRLQARHGDRPDAVTWRQLSGIQDLGQFLQSARATTLRSWLLQFGSESSGHDIELSLRQQFRDYLTQVAAWQPRRWRDALLWARRLADLAALHYLLEGGEPLAWMSDDRDLAPFAQGDPRERAQHFDGSHGTALSMARRDGTSLAERWVEHWRSLWPPTSRRAAASLEEFALLVRRHGNALAAASDIAQAARERERFEARLVIRFRRHTHTPVAAYLHLSLVALDLIRLRGALSRRCWLAESGGIAQ